jgi:hypothetical protein
MHSANGFLVADSVPVFFSNSNYFLYMLPPNYQQVFDRYGINPRKIAGIAHPSANYLNLTAFLRWVNHCSGKLTLLSDDKPQMNIIKKLFSRAKISYKSLSSAETTITPNLHVKELNGTTNLEISYLTDETSPTRIIYISNSKGIEKIIKMTPDCFILPYSVFEANNLILKSIKTPYLILEDDNPNFTKLSSLSHRPLYRKVNYTIQKFESSNDCLNFFNSVIDNETLNALVAIDKPENYQHICDFFENESSPFSRINCISIIKYFIHIATNRKISSHLKKMVQNYAVQNSVENLIAMDIKFSSKLLIADEGVFTVYMPLNETHRQKNYIPMVPVQIPTDESSFKNGDEYHDYASKIENDRKRLHELVQLYLGNGKTKPVRSLKKAITERKEIYKQNILSLEDINKLHINQIFDEQQQNESETKTSLKELLSRFLSKTGSFLFSKERFDQYMIRKNQYAAQKELKGVKPRLSHLTVRPLWYSTPIIFFRSLNRLIIALLMIALISIMFLLYWKAYQPKSLYQTIQEGFTATKTTAVDVPATTDPDINSSSEPGRDSDVTAESSINETESGIASDEEMIAPLTEKRDLEELIEGEDNEEAIKRFEIHISDTDVLFYLNEIAVMNGFRPLGPDEVKGKNPHWIFPGSIFTLPDSDRFIVREGDSLWKIAELKLTKMSIEFHRSVEEIEAYSGETRPDTLFDKASANSFNPSQKEYLKKLENRFK